jgi:hypothetical protein
LKKLKIHFSFAHGFSICRSGKCIEGKENSDPNEPALMNKLLLLLKSGVPVLKKCFEGKHCVPEIVSRVCFESGQY